MRLKKNFFLKNIEIFKENLFFWANENFSKFVYLDSNDFKDFSPNFSFEKIFALGISDELKIQKEDNFSNLKKFYEEKKDWLFGFFTYDLKNELEDLKSENIDNVFFPKIHFFCPQIIFFFKKNKLEIEFLNDFFNENQIIEIVENLSKKNFFKKTPIFLKKKIQRRFTKKEYFDILKKLKNHIKIGDIYEINFCQEFFSEETEINSIRTFFDLKEISPTPFSCFYKLEDKFLLSASPERFLKKVGNKIISQPIKGTIKRGINKLEDEILKKQLKNDEKERAENIL